MGISGAVYLYIAHLTASGTRPATVRLRRYQLLHFAAGVGVTSLERLSAEHVEAWVSERPWSPNTARSNRAALRGFFRWCVRAGHIEKSPVEYLRVGPAPRPIPRPVDDEAYAFALQVADPRERLMLRLAAEAGLRRGEVAQAHTRDLVEDLAGWSLVVHGKGGRTRLVPLKASLADELRATPPGYLFPGRIDGHLSAEHVGVLVRRLLPERYSMHKLRTRFGTRAYAATRDLRGVQELLGHASPTTTQIYVHIPPDALRAIVNAV